MQKTINDIFDELKANEIENLVNQNDVLNVSDDTLKAVKDKVYARQGCIRKKNSRVFCRQTYAAIAACIALIFTITFIAKFINIKHGHSPKPTSMPTIDGYNPEQTSIPAPQYYGSEESSVYNSLNSQILAHPSNISVTAELIEVLPDTYTFFDDWQQNEFRLLKMKTVKLLGGKRITEEFYYRLPVKYMTDFTIYDKFILVYINQLCYEYSVLYNKTQGKAEQINLIIFGYNYFRDLDIYAAHFIPFDSNGSFDNRLWKSSSAWIEAAENASAASTLVQTEKDIQARELNKGKDINLLQEELSAEDKLLLESVKNFENGLYIPESSASLLTGMSLGDLFCIRYINGFATNEHICMGTRSATSTSSFEKDDLASLPNLASALAYVASEYAKGNILPPHISNHQSLQLSSYGIFSWYAKTNEGVIGVVRVTWKYSDDKFDDAYYIVRYSSDDCTQIERDALLTLLEGHSTLYIYDGAYNENGKDFPRINF